jgi:hypothetical protein
MTRALTTGAIVCAHCGTRNIRDGEPDHLCVGSILDWYEEAGQGQGAHTWDEWVTVLLQTLGDLGLA